MTAEPRVNEVSELQREWQADSVLAAALNSAFDRIGFSEEYIASLRLGSKRKAIKDNVWGMLDFSAHEMRLIDSPLLQRMRGIRQLGFSYLTYPSAEHTRFIHSLGMAHVVSRFIASIDRDRSDDNTTLGSSISQFQQFKVLEPLAKRELTYAALLHDVGHMPFSHATETPIAGRPELFLFGGQPVEERLTRARFAVGKDISLSEALSITIILSERFERFYAKLDYDLSQDTNSILRIACLIAGVPATDSSPNIQDIISSAAVDADKIDYVNRDARACGISVGVDVSRIFLGGGLVQTKRTAFDETYEGDETVNLFVVNSSGADTLDEIVQARSSLYQRVYLHPLTRTAEALLARALEANAGSQTPATVLHDAVALWSMSDAELIGAIIGAPTPEISRLGQDLSLRNLPKKACAFAGSIASIQVPLRAQIKGLSKEIENSIRKDVANSFLEQLTRERIGEIGATYLEDEILREANELSALLKKARQSKLVPASDLKLVVITPIAVMGTSRPDAQVFQNGEIIRTPAITNVQGQHDAYEIFKAVGYVMCDPDWRQIVLQAARKVFYRESLRRNSDLVNHNMGQAAPASFQRHTLLEYETTVRRSNLKTSDADVLEHAASRAGYFDDMPLLAKRTKTSQASVQATAQTFGTFDGENGWRVKSGTVAAFADQFPPKLRDSLLATLSKGTYLGQSELQKLLLAATEKLMQADGTSSVGAQLAPLSSSSGGAALSVLKPGLPKGFHPAQSLSDALATNAQEPIIVVDDNAVSGVQSAAQLYAFSGRNRADWPEELRGERDLLGPLPEDAWKQLCSKPFGIAVAVGAKSAADRLNEAAVALGLKQFLGLAWGTEVGAGLLWARDVEEHLRGVGRELLARHKYGKQYRDLVDLEKTFCDSHCFGYGNRGAITITGINVPSSTVTALWQPGVYQGRPWVPLFLRRGRYSELVLS